MKLFLKSCFLGLWFCSLSVAHAVTLDGLQEVANQLVASLPNAGKHPEFKNDVIAEVECLCRVPREHLESIYRYGLVNQHQSGKSRGLYDPEERLIRELEMSECKPDSMSTSELSELLPIYGFLNFKTPTQTARPYPHTMGTGFGSIILVFHPNSFDSITYTLGDSLCNEALSSIPLSDLAPLESLIHSTEFHHYIELQKWGPKGRRINRENVKEISIPHVLSEINPETRVILEQIHQETGIPITVYTQHLHEREAFQVIRTPHSPLSSLRSNQSPSETKTQESAIPALLESSLAFQRNRWPDLANTNPELKNRAETRHAAKRESLFHFGLTNTHYPKVTAAVIYALFSDPDDLNWCEDSHLDKLLTCLQDEKIRTPVLGALKKYYSHSNELLKQIQASQKSTTPSTTSSSTSFTPSLSSLISLLRELDDDPEEFKLGEIIPLTYTENSTLSENINAPPPKRKSDALSYSISTQSSAKRIRNDF